MHVIYDNPLPTGWIEDPLGSLVDTKRGCSWSKEQERDRPADGTLPVIRIPNIQSSLDLTNLLHIDGLSDEQRTASAVTKGWTLLVGSNGNPKRIGDSVLMDEDREMIFASFLFALRPKVDGRKVTDEFIACWLHAHRVHEFISETSQMTTGLANISWSACRKLPVRLPKSEEEQSRIAETLKAADVQIRALEEQVRKAERVKKALLLAGFPPYLKGFNPPAGFRIKSLRQLVASWANGLYVEDSEYGSGVPIIRIDTFEDGYFYSRDFKRVRIDEVIRDRFAVLKGDVLVNRVNSHPFLGKVVFVDRLDEPTVFESNMMRLHFSSHIVAQWTSLALSSPAYKRLIWSLGRPAVGQLSINQREVSQIHLVVPDTEAQMQDAIEQIGAARSYVEALNHQLTAARRVKQSLLQNLLTGKIRLKP